MEGQHMAQNSFAQFIGKSPATLSSIFTGRTRPTLDIVEAIKSRIPNISTDWLILGRGPMYIDSTASESATTETPPAKPTEAVLDFSMSSSAPSAPVQSGYRSMSVDSAPKKVEENTIKYVDKPRRMITEIRVFYDDQTWESFVPKK